MNTLIDQNSEQRNCTLLDSLPGMAYRSIAEFPRSLAYASNGFFRLTGHTVDSFSRNFTTWDDIAHSDDLAMIAGEIEAARREQRGFSLTYRITHASGEIRWVLDRSQLVCNENGSPVAIEGLIIDTTDERREKQALRESEERFRATFDHVRIGLAHVGLSQVGQSSPGSWLRVNDHFCQMTGYSREELLTLTFQDITHPDDLEDDLEELGRLMSGETNTYSIEKRYICKDGSFLWVNLTASLVRTPSGDPDFGIAVVEDISTRKRAEDQLRQAHERLSLAQRAGQAGLWDWNMKDPAPPFVSPEYRELHGIVDDEPVTYERWLSRVYDEDRDQVEAYGREVFAQGREYRAEYRIKHPCLGLRWLASVGMVSRDAEGNPERFSGLNIDITELKETQQALRASEERLRNVIDSMFAFVGVLAPDGTVTEANQAPIDISGLTRADFLGKKIWNCRWFDYDPAVQARLKHAFDRATCGEVVRYDETIWTKDNGRVVIDLMIRPIFAGDKLQFLIPCAVDITDRKRAEEALKDSDRRKDEFLATLAHELRNPLAPLRAGFEVMKRSLDPAKRERALDMMERQLHHMARLIGDLLDISRISRGQVELQTEQVPLQLVIEQAIESSHPLIEAGAHSLTVKVPEEPLWINGDITRLTQVFGNLLNNSAKYTQNGGRIELSAVVENNQAVVRVTDEGIGIAPEMMPKVFDMFAQSDRDRGLAQGGLGIGLFIVQRFVEMHGGNVVIERSSVGRGSTFAVRLPLATVSRDEANTLQPRTIPPAVRRRRVLVVDDNKDAAEMMATLLDMDGYETRTAYDGPSGLTAAREFAPDAVFLDIGMPGLSGHQVARQLRADPNFAGVVLVALTGWGGKEDKLQSKEAGFDFHLTKPADTAEIESILAGLGAS